MNVKYLNWRRETVTPFSLTLFEVDMRVSKQKSQYFYMLAFKGRELMRSKFYKNRANAEKAMEKAVDALKAGLENKKC